MEAKFIIAANRLPVTIRETSSALRIQPSPGGAAAALNPILAEPSTVWVGYSGLERLVSKEELQANGLPPKLEPVCIPGDVYQKYYLRVANGALWPVFHGFVPRRMYTQTDWEAYVAANTAFAERIANIAKPQDSIWVHDFQLMLVPGMLRRYGLKNRLGFFLHIPFATPDLLQSLPHCREIMKSLCAADLVGVQTPRDVGLFAQCVKAQNIQNSPPVHEFAVGIDYAAYHAASQLPQVKAYLRDITQRQTGKHVIFSMSRLDYTKGILQQLKAVGMVLARHPEAQNITYKLIVAPSREELGEYKDLKGAINKCVKDINRRFPWRPIHYEYRNLHFQELAAWYCRTDIMLVTPLVDGMNLVAKEYIAVKPAGKGVLVLSQAVGAAEQLQSAVLVDPHDVASIAAGIQQALSMRPGERGRRHQALLRNVATENASNWAQTFKDALHNIHTK